MTVAYKHQLPVSVTLSYGEWAELLEAAGEHIASEVRNKRGERRAAEQMLPYLRAYTQIVSRSRRDNYEFSGTCMWVYRELLKQFDPGMCKETERRYETAQESEEIVLYTSETKAK